MWHPPLANHSSDKQKDEEDKLVQLALKKSLEPVKVGCYGCKEEFDDQDQLQIHQLDCNEIGNSGPTCGQQEDLHCGVQGIGSEQYIETQFVGLGESVFSSPLPLANTTNSVPAPVVRRKSSRVHKKQKK